MKKSAECKEILGSCALIPVLDKGKLPRGWDRVKSNDVLDTMPGWASYSLYLADFYGGELDNEAFNLFNCLYKAGLTSSLLG